MPLQKRATAELDSPAAGNQGPPLVVVGTTGLPFGPLRPRKAVPLYRVLWKSMCQSLLAASSEASWRKSRERQGRVPAPTLSDVATSWAVRWILHSKRDGTCQAVIVYPGPWANQGHMARQASREKICLERREQSSKVSMAGKESENSTRDWAPSAIAFETPICSANLSASGGCASPPQK